jgi:nitrogenase molybdenum-iron protein alpha/beta subunit
MIPKQKAEELFLKYLRLQEPNYNWFHKALAKKCALIAVDEIIEALLEYDNRNATYELQNMDRDFSYWEQVKQQIEKL